MLVTVVIVVVTAVIVVVTAVIVLATACADRRSVYGHLYLTMDSAKTDVNAIPLTDTSQINLSAKTSVNAIPLTDTSQINLYEKETTE